MVNVDKAQEFIGSIIIDLIGLLSYLLPGIGESTDIATAPLNLAWIYGMFDDDGEVTTGEGALSAFGLVEEAAPFIDIIPSATIAWYYKWYMTRE